MTIFSTQRWIFRDPGKYWTTKHLKSGKNLGPRNPEKDTDLVDHIRQATRSRSDKYSGTLDLKTALRNKYDEKSKPPFDNTHLIIIDYEGLCEYLLNKYPERFLAGDLILDVSTQEKFYETVKLHSRWADDISNSYVEQACSYACKSFEVIFNNIEIPKEFYHEIPWRVVEVMMKHYPTQDMVAEKAIEFCEKYKTEQEIEENICVMEQNDSKLDWFYSATGLIPNNRDKVIGEKINTSLGKTAYVDRNMKEAFPFESEKQQFVGYINKVLPAYLNESHMTNEFKKTYISKLQKDLKNVFEIFKNDIKEYSDWINHSFEKNRDRWL